MAAEGNNIRRFYRGEEVRSYIYRGEEGEVIPHDRIFVIVHKDVTVILESAFSGRHSIIEVICHDSVEKIERDAFYYCYALRRVIMPGVKIVERGAFKSCTSLRSINLPSVETVKENAFCGCNALTDAKFGNKLERFEGKAFLKCCSLARITIPLKDGLITSDSVFRECRKLKHANLVEGELHETIDALQLGDWRNDIYEEIESINQILPNAFGGIYNILGRVYAAGEKAQVIREWVRSVLRKIIHYQTEHQRLLNEAGSTLHHALPHDIVMNNVLPFLELPSHTFEVED